MQEIQYTGDHGGRDRVCDRDILWSGSGGSHMDPEPDQVSNSGSCARIHPAGEIGYDYYIWLARAYDDPSQDFDIKLEY